MNRYVNKYRKIVDSLIEKSFPNLRGKKIIVTETKILNFNYSATTVYFVFLSWIGVHPKSKKYPPEALTALFAHELAHIDLIANMGVWQKLIFAFSWLFTKKCKANFEKDADMLAIKKGYGKGLIKFEEEALKGYSRRKLSGVFERGYLSVKETKDYMKKCQ